MSLLGSGTRIYVPTTARSDPLFVGHCPSLRANQMSNSGKKDIFFFGDEDTEGNGTQKNLLGGKGANLAEMSNIGLPVPAGFTISTAVCAEFQRDGALSDALKASVREAMSRLERATKKTFGSGENPLLVSVRSGAPTSMPGMMDTVLNLGMNGDVRGAMETLSGSARFVRDSQRRFIQMFGNVVGGVSGHIFERELDDVKERHGASHDTELTPAALDEVIAQYLTAFEAATGDSFPDDPWDQLYLAIEAVFRSWNNTRAVTYRRLNQIPDDLGTAVNIQAMVFGNLGEGCGTGVGFTRDPSTGAKQFYGEFLPNAQGEDVVAGIRTPIPVRKERAVALKLGGQSMEETFPKIFTELMEISARLERHYKDVQDIEFTIEHDRLY